MLLTDYLQRIGKPIAYYPGLVPLTGSVTATIFLCQMLYWKGEEQTPVGWLNKTQREKRTDPAIRRLVDWNYGLWENSPPEELNGNGGGRVAKIFSELLKSLGGRGDLKDTENYIRRLYIYYRDTSPAGRNVDWIFGDEVKSLAKFRGKFADVEAFWRKNTNQAVKPAVKNFGVPDHILERNKLPFLEVK